MIGGLNHPQISAGAGVVFVLGRYIYCSNYSTGDPSKRTRGLFFMLGMITLLGTTVSTIYNLAKA
jgi:glutathione S-transferase